MMAHFAIAALASAGTLAPALAQEPAVRGRALLRTMCASCHAIDKKGPSLRRGAPPFREIGQSYDLDHFARRLRGGLASTHPDMPEFRFSEDDADAVVAYLRTIQE